MSIFHSYNVSKKIDSKIDKHYIYIQLKAKQRKKQWQKLLVSIWVQPTR
jgi:hypothetical protein